MERMFYRGDYEFKGRRKVNDRATKIPKRCVHCDYWALTDDDQSVDSVQIGTCHLDPPQVVVRSGEALAIHPHTTALDHCSHWRLRVDA